MVDSEPNEFQTILTESDPYHLRLDSDRVEVERFIGRYLVDWGYVEFFLALTISAWTSGIRNVHRAFITQSAHSKINFLRGLLPPTWQAGAALVQHLEDGNSFRNALAHSNVAMGSASEAGTYGTSKGGTQLLTSPPRCELTSSPGWQFSGRR